MEPIQMIQQALVTLSPLIANGALARVGENATDRVTHLVGQAWNLIQNGAQGNPKAQNALDVYQEEPDDERNMDRLAKLLADNLAQHHQLVADLRMLVTELQRETGQQPGNITGNATVHGPNYGQNVGVNTGTMNNNTQTINNNASNQGAQGTFHGPVNIKNKN